MKDNGYPDYQNADSSVCIFGNVWGIAIASSGEGNVARNATRNPFLLNKLCLTK